jgi:hypothetical protein
MPRTRSIVVTALLIATSAISLAACGGSNTSSSTTPTSALLVTYGKDPTQSAKMICAPEAQSEIDAALGVPTTAVTPPTWVDHVYSCTYEYANGSFTMSVKEFPTIRATVDYYDAQKPKHPIAQLLELGQDGFVSRDTTAVVRKDNKVLMVDVSKLPAHFGTPPENHAAVSAAIATVILGCWTGQ